MGRGEAQIARERPVAGVDTVHGAGGGARRHRVHDHDEVEARPGIEQPRRLVVALEHGGTGRAQPVGDERAHGVVAAIAAAEAGGRALTCVRLRA